MTSVQNKMKKLFDSWAECRIFSEGDQVLALLPITTSPFQAKYTGPHKVVKRLSEHNYIIATPEIRKTNQLCHVKLLKPYYEFTDLSMSYVQRSQEPALPACSVGRESVVYFPQLVTSEVEDGLPAPDPAVLQGHLKNSETLGNLQILLDHLSESKRADLVSLIESSSCLFGDTPTQMHYII